MDLHINCSNSNRGWKGINILYDNCVVERCKISGTERAIQLSAGEGNFINNNNCSGNGIGVYAINSNDNTITNNTLINNDAGIYIHHGRNNTIWNNSCDDNQMWGIFIDGSYKNVIWNNTCSDNQEGGLVLYISCKENIILNNIFKSNNNYGMEIYWGTNNNSIYYNCFISNNRGETQASDNGTNNFWNTQTGGNYWSDWVEPDDDEDSIVDFPYNLHGTANSKDYFPLVEFDIGIVPIANAGDDVIIDQHQIVIFNSSECLKREFIVNYTWTFIYNNITRFLYRSSPNFTFHFAGIYSVIMKVENSNGYSTEDTMTVTVRDITSPIANNGENITLDQHETTILSGSASSDNVGIVDYVWEFFYDDHLVELFGETVTFIFHTAGRYVVNLSVFDAEGNRDNDTLNITVIDITRPNASAGEDIVIDQHEIVNFDGNDSYDNVGIVNYSWSFVNRENKISLYGPNPTFRFDDAGFFIVILNISDTEGNWDIDAVNITVLDITPPTAYAGPDLTINTDFRGGYEFHNLFVFK